MLQLIIYVFTTNRYLTLVCLKGPIWNTSSLLAPTSDRLYIDEMHLVVRENSPTIVETMFFSVVSAFTPLAWIAIFLIILMYAITVDLVTNFPITRSIVRHFASCGRMGK